MSQPSTPTKIFHITAIDNLAAIVASGALRSKRELVAKAVPHASIAYEHIQDRRARKVVPVGPGGTLHDYVPFHFAPRSPMLFAINGGKVQSCPYRQADIVHLVAHAEDVVQAGLPFVFSNYHAVLDFAEFFADLKFLDRIDWPLFFESPNPGGYCQYWQNRPDARYMLRKETRQAEFLVHGQMPISLVRGIAVYDGAAEARVRTALQQAAWEVPVKAIPAWYY